MGKIIYKFDDKGNLIYHKSSNGEGYWLEYGENNNEVYGKDLGPYKYWKKQGNSGRLILITKKEFEEIEFRIKEKGYNSRTKCSRFELMEI